MSTQIDRIIEVVFYRPHGLTLSEARRAAFTLMTEPGLQLTADDAAGWVFAQITGQTWEAICRRGGWRLELQEWERAAREGTVSEPGTL